ncbi:hypothetical protein SDJN02_26571, partial [Cucurbita argyrosperma subsp. argyrosperma]
MAVPSVQKPRAYTRIIESMKSITKGLQLVCADLLYTVAMVDQVLEIKL